jgi:hypothetical protein
MVAPDVPVGFPAADHRQGREHKISANQSTGWNYLPTRAENTKYLPIRAQDVIVRQSEQRIKISPNQYKKRIYLLITV